MGRGESGGRENSEEVWKDDCVSRKARKRVFSQSSVKKLKVYGSLSFSAIFDI